MKAKGVPLHRIRSETGTAPNRVLDHGSVPLLPTVDDQRYPTLRIPRFSLLIANVMTSAGGTDSSGRISGGRIQVRPLILLMTSVGAMWLM